jgi:hypothetical protein
MTRPCSPPARYARRLARLGMVVSACCMVGAAGSSCGGSKHKPPADPPPAEASPADPPATTHAPAPAKPKDPPKPDPVTIPTACDSKDGEICLPPAAFVQQLCQGPQPNVAFTLFRKGTPWTRAYVRRNEMEAWYASGGHSRPAKLRFAEELIVLATRTKATGGMQVSGSGSYDMFRWDGTCVSVMSDEISLRCPTMPDVAPIPWKRLDSDIQSALLKNAKVSFRNDGWQKACKETGPGSDRHCETAELSLSRIIGEFVRGGGEIPMRGGLEP